MLINSRCLPDTAALRWPPASIRHTAAVNTRLWQTRAARGYAWQSHGPAAARPGAPNVSATAGRA